MLNFSSTGEKKLASKHHGSSSRSAEMEAPAALYLDNLKTNYRLQRFDLFYSHPDKQNGILTSEIAEQPCGPNEIVVTEGQLGVGLRLPLYNPLNTFQYEVLAGLNPQRDLCQPNGNFWRILRECDFRSQGIVTAHERNQFYPSKSYLYTPDSFLDNYWCHHLIGEKFEGFGVGISRNHRALRGPLLLTDLDPHSPSNITLRKTNDPKWLVCPIRVVGPYVYGWDDVGGVLPGLPEMHGALPDYRPWELNWTTAPVVRKCRITRAQAIRDAEDAQVDNTFL